MDIRSRIAGACVVLAVVVAVLVLIAVGRNARRAAYSGATLDPDPSGAQAPEGVGGPVQPAGRRVHRLYPPCLTDTPYSALNFGGC